MRARWPDAVCAVTPAAWARSEAVWARPSISSCSMDARAGSPIRAATSDRALTVIMAGNLGPRRARAPRPIVRWWPKDHVPHRPRASRRANVTELRHGAEIRCAHCPTVGQRVLTLREETNESAPLRIGDGDLVGGGGFEMRHQRGIALVALAGAQLPRELAVELGERAVAAEQRDQPRVLARVGGRAEPRLRARGWRASSPPRASGSRAAARRGRAPASPPRAGNRRSR